MLEGTQDQPSDAEVVSDEDLFFDDPAEEGLPSTIFARRRAPVAAPREGEVLAGRYRVERIPGRRGLGVVLDVRHLELGRDLTLKYLVPDACVHPEYVRRFMREARSAVRIEGEHVARVTDVGRLDSGAPYMVRESLRGPDLAEVLKVRGPLPLAEAVDYVIQACEGVAEGHLLGIVHGNLRPTTLVVTRRSDRTALVKVFDFAASDALHVDPFAEDAVRMGSSAILGSVPYMAPEQIRDPYDVDVRADVYALGAILYELLAGVPAFSAASAPALLAAVVADPAPSLRGLRPETPAGLDAVCLCCLAKQRAVRYPSLAELVLALQPFASADSALSIQRVLRVARHPSLDIGARVGFGGDARVRQTLPYAVPRVAPSASVPPAAFANVQAASAPPPPIPPRPAPSVGWKPPWHRPPAPSQTDPTILPPSRSSVPGGLARSWAPEAPPHQHWSRTVGVVLVAACSLFAVFALGRSSRPTTAPVSAARPAAVTQLSPVAPAVEGPLRDAEPARTAASALTPPSAPTAHNAPAAATPAPQRAAPPTRVLAASPVVAAPAPVPAAEPAPITVGVPQPASKPLPPAEPPKRLLFTDPN